MKELKFEENPKYHPFANKNPLAIIRLGEIFVCLLRNHEGTIFAHCEPISEEFAYTATHLAVQITNANARLVKQIMPMIFNAYQHTINDRVVYMLDGG